MQSDPENVHLVRLFKQFFHRIRALYNSDLMMLQHLRRRRKGAEGVYAEAIHSLDAAMLKHFSDIVKYERGRRHRLKELKKQHAAGNIVEDLQMYVRDIIAAEDNAFYTSLFADAAKRTQLAEACGMQPDRWYVDSIRPSLNADVIKEIDQCSIKSVTKPVVLPSKRPAVSENYLTTMVSMLHTWYEQNINKENSSTQ